LSQMLEAASYPIRETKLIYRSEDNVEITRELVTLAAVSAELNRVVTGPTSLARVSHATWNVSAME
jgi:putative Mg2+ transporter-C (MgtC) family protein